jgi:hypothetical protein
MDKRGSTAGSSRTGAVHFCANGPTIETVYRQEVPVANRGRWMTETRRHKVKMILIISFLSRRLRWPLDCTCRTTTGVEATRDVYLEPPSRPSSEARSRSAPKPCSDEVRLSGVPSSFTVRDNQNDQFKYGKGRSNRRLTAIVLGRLVLLGGSTSLAGLGCSFPVTAEAVLRGDSLVGGTVFLHCERRRGSV